MYRFINIKFFDTPRQSTANSRMLIRDYYDRTALEEAIPLLTFRKFGQKRFIPKNEGKTIKFTRWGRLAAATTPISDGITPAGNRLTQSDVTATLDQYGDFILITDQVIMTAIDHYLSEAVRILGNQQGETIDRLASNMMLTGSNAVYADTATPGTAATSRDEVAAKISNKMLKKAVQTLQVAMAKEIREQVDATVKYNTSPIRKAFIGICHVYSRQDIEDLSNFTPVRKYANQSDVMEGEFGEVDGVRFIATTQAPEFLGAGANGTAIRETGNLADIYPTFIFGQDAYGEVPLSNNSSAIIIKAPKANDDSNTSDPLNQRSTVGWKTMTTFKILNDLWIVRLEHAVSEL